ncbi:MAG: hypothetical protein K0R29_2709 [Pseudobdellovibrio sp.]|jgi:hypothetical protein|nr:hypothetical protein [Pseudobdellovibrio sp.]
MNFTPADSLSLSAFIVFSIIMTALFHYVFQKVKAPARYPLIWWAYVIFFSTVVLSGLPGKLIIPVVPLLFATLLGLYLYFAFSTFGKTVSAQFSAAALIGFQCFRLPLELILHQWAAGGTIPETMTWTGQNWDVITGIVSLITIPFLNRSKKLAYAVNILGFILLMNVLRVVVMSSPLPFAWPLNNPLQLVFYFPYCLIAPLFVGPALFGHVVAFRKLSLSQ